MPASAPSIALVASSGGIGSAKRTVKYGMFGSGSISAGAEVCVTPAWAKPIPSPARSGATRLRVKSPNFSAASGNFPEARTTNASDSAAPLVCASASHPAASSAENAVRRTNVAVHVSLNISLVQEALFCSPNGFFESSKKRQKIFKNCHYEPGDENTCISPAQPDALSRYL